MLIEILVTIATILALMYLYLIWNFDYWKKRGVPGPDPKVLLGTLPNYITQKQSVFCDIDEIYQKFKNIDRFVGIFLIRKPALLILDPNLVHEILTTNFKYFAVSDPDFMDKNVDRIFARNPFVLSGMEWKEQRSQVTPALTQLKIKSMYPVLLSIGRGLAKFIENENHRQSKAVFNGRILASRYTIETVANILYGFEAGAFVPENEKCEMMEMCYGIFDNSTLAQLYTFITKIIPNIKIIYNRPAIPRRSEKYLIGLLKHAIDLRKQNPTDRTDFLNYLLQLQEKKNLSQFDLTQHAMTLYFDTFETSSVMISNCLYLLAKHQDVQDRLRQEIRQIFPASSLYKEIDLINENEIKSFEQVLDLKYFDNVINESFRLMPVLGVLSKLCTEPCELINSKGERIKVAKDEIIKIPVPSIQHDEKYFKNAKEFKPERFDEYEDAAKVFKDMGIFLPFSDGPKICMGQKFSITQVKAAIFEIVRNWKVKLNDKTLKEFEPDPTTFFYTLKGGIWLEFEKVF